MCFLFLIYVLHKLFLTKASTLLLSRNCVPPWIANTKNTKPHQPSNSARRTWPMIRTSAPALSSDDPLRFFDCRRRSISMCKMNDIVYVIFILILRSHSLITGPKKVSHFNAQIASRRKFNFFSLWHFVFGDLIRVQNQRERLRVHSEEHIASDNVFLNKVRSNVTIYIFLHTKPGAKNCVNLHQ